jgi:hypothetical protein
MTNYEKIIRIIRDYILFIDERIKAQVLQPVHWSYAAKKTSATGTVYNMLGIGVRLSPDSADLHYTNTGNLTCGRTRSNH